MNSLQDESSGLWEGPFWDYDIKAKSFECLSVQADIKFFTKFLLEETKGRSVMLHRAESLIHGKYSEWSKEWWTVSSMICTLFNVVTLSHTTVS